MINLTHYKNKTIAIYGLGITGSASAKALSAAGARLFAWDDNTANREALTDLSHTDFTDFETWPWEKIDLLVLSAGIPLTHPKPHPVVLKAQAHNCQVTCDIELLYQAQKDTPIIGITGTNGKSTTTSLIGHVLKTCGQKIEVGGNIGTPGPALEPLDKDGAYVIELSSYQLDLLQETRCHIAVLLNVTPDHLDRHGDMEGYIAAKEKIFARQTSNDFAVIAVDDVPSQTLYETYKDKLATMVAVSAKRILEEGISIIGDMLYDHLDGKKEVYQFGPFTHLAGPHNAQNAACAYAVARINGFTADAILNSFASFTSLEHRMEVVCKKDNILFINDSKATNAEATKPALHAFNSIYWIAGGIAKEGGIQTLKNELENVKKLYLIGQSTDQFAQDMEDHLAIAKCYHLEDAIKQATKDAKNDPEAAILFSPACASFDQYPNFMKRGEAFCKLVKAMP